MGREVTVLTVVVRQCEPLADFVEMLLDQPFQKNGLTPSGFSILFQ